MAEHRNRQLLTTVATATADCCRSQEDVFLRLSDSIQAPARAVQHARAGDFNREAIMQTRKVFISAVYLSIGAALQCSCAPEDFSETSLSDGSDTAEEDIGSAQQALVFTFQQYWSGRAEYRASKDFIANSPDLWIGGMCGAGHGADTSWVELLQTKDQRVIDNFSFPCDSTAHRKRTQTAHQAGVAYYFRWHSNAIYADPPSQGVYAWR